MKIKGILFIVFCTLSITIYFSSCNNKVEAQTVKQQESWSIRMANSVLNQSDSLIWYKDIPKPKWTYDLAFLGQAVDKLGVYDTVYSKYAKDYIDYFVQDNGVINKYKYYDYNLDNVNPGKYLFTLYKRTGEEKYKTALDTLYKQILEQPKTNSGGFWHKERYPYQMWLDGIYMASPFIAQYGSELNKPELFDLVTHQVKLIYKETYDPETGLLYHAWDESRQQKWCDKETGKSKEFWGRAIGWYVLAIVDILDYLPEDHKDRPELIKILNEVCIALEKVEDPETGLWYQVLDKGGQEGNYIESSASSMFIYAFAKGAKNKYLPQEYLTKANIKFDSLTENQITTDENGFIKLNNICGGAGLGGNPYRMGDYDYYIHERKVLNDAKGVAPFILAAIELNK